MKKNLIIYAIIWVISVVIISFYGGPVSYGLFYTVSAIPFISLAHLIAEFFYMKIYQKTSIANITAGTSFPFYFTLQNNTFFSFTNMKVNFFSTFSTIKGFEINDEFELYPFANKTKETTIVCKYRGDYEIGIKNIEMTDFFRLFKFKYKPNETVKVSVAPAVHYLKNLKTLDINTLSPLESMTAKNIPDILVRDYQPYDSMRNINWKVSAKEGKLKTRKMIGEEKNCINILMDTQRISDKEEIFIPLESKILETAIALSICIAEKNINANVLYLSPALQVTKLTDMNHFANFYSTISKTYFEKGNSFDDLFHNANAFIDSSNAQITIMILHEMTDSVFALCHKLSDNNITTVIYLINDKIPDSKYHTEGLRMKIIQIPSDASVEEVL